MQLEMFINGIGGQGIQLMAKVLALAALTERRHVLLAADYGFEMRGGSSIASIVLGSEPLNALPVLAGADAAVVMHNSSFEKPLSRLRPGALVVADKALAEYLPMLPDQRLVLVDATAVAREIGNPMTAGLCLLAGFAAVTGVVRTQSLVAAMKSTVPSYRTAHIAANERAITLVVERVSDFHPIDLDACVRVAAI